MCIRDRYYLFEYLETHYDFPGATLFQFVSFRASMAILISLGITLVFGSRIIRSLKKMQVSESVRDLGLAGQKEKEGTPTMGGIMIVLAIVIPTLLLARLDNIYVILMLVSTIWFAMIGFLDDRLKLKKKNKDGLRGKYKIIGQVVMGLIVAMVMLMHEDIVVRVPVEVAQENNWTITKQFPQVIPQINAAPITRTMAYAKAPITNMPILKDNELDYAWFVGNNSHLIWIVFVPIMIFIITSVSNAANLTDGLDGLLTGIAAVIGFTLAVLAYVVSYTHLRAHETEADLVCRLLLEKKKK